jgi:hypothetical protein
MGKQKHPLDPLIEMLSAGVKAAKHSRSVSMAVSKLIHEVTDLRARVKALEIESRTKEYGDIQQSQMDRAIPHPFTGRRPRS